MVIYLGIMASQTRMTQINSVLRANKPPLLQSYFYDKERVLTDLSNDIMFDSGAFTLFSSKNRTSDIDWEKYVDSYADFIRTNKIKRYLELDIDALIGYDKVKVLRSRLEKRVGWKSIPVWHKSRGLEDFKAMCDSHKYVSIGGIVSGEIKKNEFHHLKTLINMSHEKGCLIHGLGFTKINILDQYHFDSVDSVSWKGGSMYGYCYIFDGKNMNKIYPTNTQKFIGGRNSFGHDLNEWIKFQKYAERFL